ncbi:GDSL-type esterase/lipase family protein [Maribacter sp. 2307ULW6-5]|uniref:GDSL-type esterase/lipase family protein n=1 Tax=Maribacter sp. 2307ULW6-5 TaxID=3386275 RepID=UPI0039BC93F0
MFKRYKVFMLLLLASLLAANSCAPTHKYRHHLTKWESDIDRFTELDRNQEYPDNSIMFLGSSSIRLWDSIEEDMAPYPVIQRGFGGSCFVDVAHYAAQETLPANLGALVLFAGNDIWGTEEDRTPEEIGKLLEYTIRKVRKRHPTMPLFVIEVTHVPKREHLIAEIDAENRELERVCGKHEQVYWIATKSMFLTQDNKIRREIFRDDDIHQNEEGYQQWTRLIKTEIKKWL